MGLVSIAILLFLISSCWGGSDDDQLVPGKPLSPGSAIVSKGGVFAFGFFPLGGSNSSTRLYVGIWYNNIPNRTVVWVANRNSPITNQSSVLLSLTDQGRLVVSDSLGGTLWKMNNNKNIAGGGTRSSAAVLLNTGNPVIQSLDGTIMWESFDRPTDTFLPGMKIWLLRNDHIAVEPFISWKSPDDPSNGDFSLGSSLKPYPQLFAWHGFNPYWRGSGSTWNGPVLKSFLWYLALIRDRNYSYLMISTSYSSTSVRFVLDSSGKLQFLS